MTTAAAPLADRLDENARAVEMFLASLLEDGCLDDEISRPATLLNAMQHAVLNGGKRLRPFLVIESARLLGGDPRTALRIGAALELVHCYSLVHDDLPAMDDDDIRRGQPTVHIAFDEATAILAGDSLLTYAFDIIASEETPLSAPGKVELVRMLARASGIGGMAGGQALDLAAEKQPPDEAGIIMLQAMKTGALIRYACEAGAVVAGAPEDERQCLRRYGETIGLAFQLSDDLLDLKSDAATMGKATGKDAARGKGTLVSLHGAAWAEARLSQLVDEAGKLLAPYGDKAGVLVDTARFVASRKS